MDATILVEVTVQIKDGVRLSYQIRQPLNQARQYTFSVEPEGKARNSVTHESQPFPSIISYQLKQLGGWTQTQIPPRVISYMIKSARVMLGEEED